MKEWTKNQLHRLRIASIINSDKRNHYIIKHHIFREVGENFFFQPRFIPSDPKLIKFHNNVVVTSNVTFVTHDIFHLGLNHLKRGDFCYQAGCIEVMDNVFIGCNSTILSNIKIGPNALIAAGSVVTKDVPPNTVVAGVPAKVIGTFEEYIKKREKNNQLYTTDALWEKFDQEKNNENQK